MYVFSFGIIANVIIGFTLLTVTIYFLFNSIESPIKWLVLNSNGSIEYDQQKNLCLHHNSRVGWLGCWVILNTDITHAQKHSSVTFAKFFIFNDSLSDIDHSRLSRAIKQNHLSALNYEETK